MIANFPAFRIASASKPLWLKMQSSIERRNNLSGERADHADFPGFALR
jgi:hypothetical protein